MYIKSFIYFLLFIPCVLYSQSFTTSGFVYDDVSEETLLDVYVYCPQTGMGTTTNNYGYYTISLPAGYYNLLFIKEGFIAKMDTIKTNRNQLLNIWLEKKMDGIEYPINPFEKKLVKLDSNKFGNFIFKNNAQTKQQIKLALERNTQIIDRTESSLLNIPGNQSSQMPNFLGETDVIRTLKQLPGVMPGSEIFNGLYIRGGAMDQNLLLLEGVPIYNVDHAFGLFSSINPDGIKNIHLTKGNFNAKQGGRLSAETDLVLKDGSSDKFNGLFTYSPFTVRLNMEGPLGNNNKTTFSFSGRRSYIDMLMRSFSEDSLKSWYTFFDYSFKLKHRFNAKNSIQFTIFQSRDRLYSLSSMQSQATYGNYSNSEETNFNWGSLITSLQYNKILNNRTFSNFGIYLSKYRANFINENHSTLDSNQVRTQSAFDFYFKNVVRDISAYINFTHNVSKFHSIDYGIKGSLRGYFPGTLTISTGLGNNRNSTIRGNNTPLQTTEISTYLDNQIQINPNTKLQIGARAVNYNYYAKHFLFFEPRANLNIRIKNEWALKAGYTLNNQNILYINQQNENFDMILNNRWLPATDKVLPQRSHQINLGFAKPYKNNIELNIEGYYKLLQRSIDYKEGTSFKIVDDQWEQKLLMGTGSCYGIETMLHKRKGDLSGWISYTLSWANRNTKGVNRGQNYYYQYDRRHYVNIVAQYKWDERTAFSANIVFSTGNLQSLPTAKYKDINGNTVYDYPYKNNYRLPNTFRIDIGIKRIRAKSIGVESGYNFSIYNLLCRQNPSYIYIDVSQSPSVAYQVSQLGVLIPGISYYIKF